MTPARAGWPATLLRRLHRLEDAVLALLLTGMIVLAAGQILLRNFFAYGLSWADPLLRILVLWLALLGAMAATREGRHIHIDLLSRFLPPLAARLARRATDLFAAAACALVAWHGGRFVWFEWQDGSELFSGVPAWSAEIIIPLGFALMALRFLLQAVLGPPAATEPAP